jgi:hypothetical protein
MATTNKETVEKFVTFPFVAKKVHSFICSSFMEWRASKFLTAYTAT